MELGNFKGKGVLVTGGTGALGRAICQAFLDEGARVASSYLLPREVDALPGSLKDRQGFTLHKADLTSPEEVSALFETVGKVDILVNVAGGFAMGSVAETQPDQWRHMLRMNLDTAFLTSRQAVRTMTGSGRIINVGAMAATQRLGGLTAYKVSKAAVIHLTESMAEETLGGEITVNAILPTIMDTPANRAAMPDADPSAWVPLEDAAFAVLFLASDRSWHVTGACLPLRGHS